MTLYQSALTRARRNGLPAPLAHVVAACRFIAASPDRIVFAGCMAMLAALLIGG